MKQKADDNVSIAIPFCFYEIKDTILALKKQEFPGRYEIIVIYDNPKTPLENSFRKFLQKNRVRIIENKENKGLAGSYNIGIKEAKYENVMLMHEDCVPTNNKLVKNLLIALNKNPSAWVDANIEIPLKIWRDYDYWNKALTFRYVGVPPGPTLGKTSIFKKSLIEKVGYFDEETFKTAGEDSDFNYRMKKMEIPMVATPDIVNHNHRAKKANFPKLVKKVWQMSEAHGAWKRKHNFPRMSYFDFEIRLVFFALMIIGIFVSPWLFLVGVSPFISIVLLKTIKNYRASKWTLGLFTYPFIGFLMIFIQLFANVKGAASGKQNSKLYQVVKQEEVNL